MFSIIIQLLACFLSLASASELPDIVSVNKRQEPGTPAYECNSNCGNVIALGRNAGHCTQTTFTNALTACLNCALQYDIWQFYSNSVGELAQGCGLNSTPTPANSTAITTTVTSSGDTATLTSTSVSFSSSSEGDAAQATTTSENASASANANAGTNTSTDGTGSTSESSAVATTAAATSGSETSSATTSAGPATTSAGGEGIGNRFSFNGILMLFSAVAVHMVIS